MRKTIAKLLGWKSENTYYDWKRQNRPIVAFLEKYFTEAELNEFLETGAMQKLEIKAHYSEELIEIKKGSKR